MNQDCINYITKTVAKYGAEEPIVDFGGATVLSDFFGCIRKIFKDKDYKTFDMNGSDVDIVGDIYDIDMPDASIATALCLNTLEHLAEPQKAVDEIARVLRPKGRIMITVPMSWSVHRYPKDYWRFLPDGMKHLLHKQFKNIEMEWDDRKQRNLLLYTTAIRGENASSKRSDTELQRQTPTRHSKFDSREL